MTAHHRAMDDSARFGGFRTGAPAITVSAEVFTDLLPLIDDEAELRVTLYALYAIARRRGALRAVRGNALARESALVRSLQSYGGTEAVEPALAAAVDRGVLLDLELDDGDRLYFVNNGGGRRQRERVRSGALTLPDRRQPVPSETPERSTPLWTYEQEIGVLTPAIAAALREAEARYPEGWVVEALRLAASNNARSWRYAEAILRRWEAEGRDDEATPGNARSADPYGHVYRRE